MRTAGLMLGVLAAALGGCELYFAPDEPGDDSPPLLDAPRAPIDGPFRPIDARFPPIDAPPPSPDAGEVIPPERLPISPTRANVLVAGDWHEVGAADWSCLGTPSTDLPSSGAVTLTGHVVDWQTRAPLAAAQVAAFPGSTPTTILGLTMSAGADTDLGRYTMTLAALPPGTTRYGFSLNVTAHLGSYVLDAYVPPGAPATRDLATISSTTAQAMYAAVGVPRDPMSWLVAGDIVDCQGRAVSNAIATLSVTRSTLNAAAGARAFYCAEAAPNLPVPTATARTSVGSGRFVILDADAADSARFVQIWGYRDNAELNSRRLTLLAELPAPAVASTAVTAVFYPRRN